MKRHLNTTIPVSKDWTPQEKLDLIKLIILEQHALCPDPNRPIFPKDLEAWLDLEELIGNLLWGDKVFLEANRQNFSDFLEK